MEQRFQGKLIKETIKSTVSDVVWSFHLIRFIISCKRYGYPSLNSRVIFERKISLDALDLIYIFDEDLHSG